MTRSGSRAPAGTRRERFVPRTAARSVRSGGVLVIATLLAACAANPAPTEQPADTSRVTEKNGKQCIYACEQWTRLCNVDPRGVYECRRSCAKFGEICEE